jgi:hypothetical protein
MEWQASFDDERHPAPDSTIDAPNDRRSVDAAPDRPIAVLP